MLQQFSTGTASTFYDLLNLVEGRLNEFLPQLLGALDQIKSDFKVNDSLTYYRMERTIGDMEHFMGTLNSIRKARNSQSDVTISLPSDFASKAEIVAGDMAYVLNQASSVFTHIHDNITSGFVNGNDQGVAAIMALAGRALRDVAESEGVILEQLQQHILKGASAHLSAQHPYYGSQSESVQS